MTTIQRRARWLRGGIGVILIGLVALLAGPRAGSGQSNVLSVAAGDQDLTILPAGAGDRLGALGAMATGDFNNDGFQDILLGAAGAERPGTERTDNGLAYVIFGKASLAETQELDLKSFTNADVVIIGADPGDRLGTAVAAGDVNGDGVDDIVLGAPGAAGPLNQDTATGEVYVIFGAPSLPAQIDLRTQRPPVTLLGRVGNGDFGSALVVTDLNADGNEDIVVGQPKGNGPGGSRPEAGGAFVYLGAVDLISPVPDVGFKDPDVTIYGRKAGDRLGTALAEGDLNADGFRDLILGAPRADGPADQRPEAGEVYVLSGARTLPAVIDLSAATTTGTGSLRVMGAEAGDRLGASVAAGDVNADGFDDLLLGAPQAAGPGNRRALAGEAYLVLGRANLPPELDLATDGQATVFSGVDALDNLGSAVAIGDVNGDAFAEVILGASNAKGGADTEAGAGEVYVISGADALPAAVDLAQDEVFARLLGAQSLDAFGSALAVGHLDGNGQGNLLVGARDADAPGGRRDSGLVYVFLTVVKEVSQVIADAGPDWWVVPGTTVPLDGSGSSDSLGRPLTFRWSLTSVPEGSQAALDDPAAVRPSFVADEVGTYEVELTVTNDQGISATDRAVIMALTKGDVDFDGDVDLIDAQLVADYIVKKIELDDGQKFAADVRPVCRPPDSAIDVNDVRWIAEFPVKGPQEPMCLEPMVKASSEGEQTP